MYVFRNPVSLAICCSVLFLSLQSCFEETMRASVVLLFAFLALVFVAADAAGEVSVIISIATYIALKLRKCLSINTTEDMHDVI